MKLSLATGRHGRIVPILTAGERRFTAVEQAEREALRARVHASVSRADPLVLIASLTPDERVQRMALHYRATGSFGPDLACRPGTGSTPDPSRVLTVPNSSATEAR